uniref:2OG-FeII_Oxy_4 domain-containing protein n=1 Tax=Heligmosomoides polygyrus TaxID=6339 RepID=A0A183GFQ3_HELPZ
LFLEKKPFPHWQLRDFLHTEPALIDKVERELIKYPGWNRKENDLYSLLQTPDLQTLDAGKYPAVIMFFREFLCGEMRKWLGETSDIELLEQVDSTGSCYATTDCLLPHSDQVENRRFAFVYYFTEEPWEESFGGQTNIYNMDVPLNHLIGKENSPRLSINGWFHTNRPIEPRVRPPLIRYCDVLCSLATISSAPLLGRSFFQKAELSTVFNGEILGDKSMECMKKAFSEKKELLVLKAFQVIELSHC